MNNRKPTVRECNYFARHGELPDSLKDDSETLKKPNSNSKKADIKAYLNQQEVEFSEDANKSELYELVE